MSNANSEENVKKILISFRRDIPRQKQALEILSKEKSETGIAYSLIIHEALLLYAEKRKNEKTQTVFSVPGVPDDMSAENQNNAEELSLTASSESDAQVENIIVDGVDEDFLMDVLDENFG